MLNYLSELTGNPRSSAKVVDGTLILSLPDALSPVVWRWNLGEAKASALEVREDKEGSFKLVLKTPRGDVQDVAPFENRQKAMSALLAVSRAMENAVTMPVAIEQTDAIPAAAPIPVVPKKDGIKVGMGLGAIVILILLFMWMNSVSPTRLDTDVRTTSATQTNPSDSSGVAVSADDFLKGM